MAKDTKGLSAKKSEDMSEWFTQLIQKAQLIEYSPVSGCYILRPRAFYVWEKLKGYFDSLITNDGVENAYFPLFIPESLLVKEEDHVEGFAAEVAWVETGGRTKLKERLAIRPTSETIMYQAYSKWIRSYNDLPLRLNQWCNVVRWEFKHCTPFLRSREFLWQEGHTAFASREEAVAEQHKILDFYEQTFKEVYAIPVMKGQKSDAEKFAGAESTLSVEALMPNGKAIQGATSHYLGQNFAKAFNITFKDEKEQDQFAHQNSWGISTRSIGMLIMTHSDDKGLVLPPFVAKTQVVIVPIFKAENKDDILKAAEELRQKIHDKDIRVRLDDREGYSPGWKYNEHELQGVPLRIELGPRDLENKQAVVARRDNSEKQILPLATLAEELDNMLEKMHQDLYEKAKAHLEQSTVHVTTKDEAIKAIEQGKIVLAPWCGSEQSEELFKQECGAKSLNAPFNQPELGDAKCFLTGEKATRFHYFGRSY